MKEKHPFLEARPALGIFVSAQAKRGSKDSKLPIFQGPETYYVKRHIVVKDCKKMPSGKGIHMYIEACGTGILTAWENRKTGSQSSSYIHMDAIAGLDSPNVLR